MSEKGLMISVSGPSGVGKGTIIEEIRRMFPECKHSISVTTRPPRGEEQDGVEYYFRTKDEFEKLVKEGEIIEYDMYVDNYYGTPATPLIEKSNRGDDVLLDITIAGSLALKRKFPQAVTIFILPPSFEKLEERLKGRGTESLELVQKRLEKAREEVLSAEKFDYVVVNDDLQTAVDNIVAIMKAEKCRYDRLSGIEKTL
ncbi:MAG: guanylate kinase [Clostridia bacterium]|nr:guanylate kinase [Clostridia bacterium]